MTVQEKTTARCPECAADVTFAEPPRLSELVECGECQVELEVVTVQPVTLTPAPEVEEDWGE
ncbi:lysine biosynthesis protein LysW [Micromonospora sp. CA-249363]|uniref:lysine biosynthesis protein LysW n=1 Tax=Micromonospora sp. CA-249363 TaxID=3239963 RepID=UPI003D8E6806